MSDSLRLNAAAATNAGRVHQLNQDTVFAVTNVTSGGDPAGLFVVADGMGGHQAGEVASQLAVATMERELLPLIDSGAGEDTEPSLPNPLAATANDGAHGYLQQRLQSAIQQANMAIIAHAQQNPNETGSMGTTITCVMVDGDQAVVANVGDSRTYRLRQRELEQLTEDHSYVARLVRAGQLQPEDIFTHPRRNVITRSLGHRADIEIDTWSHQIRAGDRFLLCSDGLWEMVQNEDLLRDYVARSDDPSATVTMLIDAANERGGADNIGVVVVHVD